MKSKKIRKKAASKLEIGKKKHKQTEVRILAILVKHLQKKKKIPALAEFRKSENPKKKNKK